MPFQVTIESTGHQFAAEPDATLLQSALDAGLLLPYGCRNGACGTCKGRVLSGTVDHGTFQESSLTAEERAAGVTLFCCAKPVSDVVIEAREVRAKSDIPVRMLPCRVQKMARVASDVMVLHLRLPAMDRLQFLAGQYIEFLLKDGKRRAFSIANAPHDDEAIELHIRLVPGGQFTGHVFRGMKEKEILRFEGPLGSFFLREESEKPMVMVAGGTGFAPIKGMIEHALHHNSTRPMTLYWGVRSLDDLYMRDLCERWASEHNHFRFVPVLSEPKPEDAWTGRTGLVHQAAMADLPDLSACQAYVCGAPPMVDAARADFTGKCSLPEKEFFADSFTFAAAT